MINNIRFDIKDSMKKENFKIKEDIDFNTKKTLDDILIKFDKEIEGKFPSSEFKTVVIDEKVEVSDDGLKCTATLKLVKRKR